MNFYAEGILLWEFEFKTLFKLVVPEGVPSPHFSDKLTRQNLS